MGPFEIRTNIDQRYIPIERDPAMPGSRTSSVPVRQMHITGYRSTGTVVVMLGNDIFRKDRAARFSMALDDLPPLADAIMELHALLEGDLRGRGSEV